MMRPALQAPALTSSLRSTTGPSTRPWRRCASDLGPRLLPRPDGRGRRRFCRRVGAVHRACTGRPAGHGRRHPTQSQPWSTAWEPYGEFQGCFRLGACLSIKRPLTRHWGRPDCPPARSSPLAARARQLTSEPGRRRGGRARRRRGSATWRPLTAGDRSPVVHSLASDSEAPLPVAGSPQQARTSPCCPAESAKSGTGLWTGPGTYIQLRSEASSGQVTRVRSAHLEFRVSAAQRCMFALPQWRRQSAGIGGPMHHHCLASLRTR
jgi:hypothetical protein